jgi:hypothetical protein
VLDRAGQDVCDGFDAAMWMPGKSGLVIVPQYARTPGGLPREIDTSGLIPVIHTSGFEVYAFRNQSDVAFEWLDRACAQRDSGLIGTKVDPLLKNLHGDPRFAAFLKKLNLPT